MIGLYSQFSPHPVSAAVTIDTSSQFNATKYSSQRKTFYDSVNNLYWAFYWNGSQAEYSNSSDGTSWTSRGTIGTTGSDFSVWKPTGSASVYLVYNDVGLLRVRAVTGTLGATSISFGSTTTVASGATGGYLNVGISADTDGKLWVMYTGDSGASGSDVYGQRSTSVGSTAAWDTAKLIQHMGSSEGTIDSMLVPMTTARDMYFVLAKNPGASCSILGVLWDDSANNFGSITAIDTLASCSYISVLATSSDQVNLTYDISGPGTVKYRNYSGGTWGSAVTLASTSATSPVISVDSGTSNLYAFWIESNIIKYKKGVSPYASGNWDASATTLVSTGTNTNLSAAYNDGANSIFLEWTDGTANPYSVKFGSVNLNSTPSAPTLSQPASGQTGVSITPQFRMFATDVNNDYLEYWIDVCSTSNCSSIVRSICQTNSGTGPPGTCASPSQTGWAGQSLQSATAYSSGQTAVHTYQTTALSANTQYWWRAYVIDPGGTNTWSSASSISTFTTALATQPNVNIGGGTTIYGGTTIGQ